MKYPPLTIITSVDYTVTYINQLILVNTSSGNINIYLPDLSQFGSSSVDFEFYVKKITGDANTVTIKTVNGSQLIDGATSTTLTSDNECKGFKFDGYSNYRVISETEAGGSTITPAALTKTDDTNVTATLTGTPLTSLLQAVNIALGWTGTLAAARLNSNVVQAITNDTNVTGSIAAQNLTLGWTGQLGLSRGGTNKNLTAVNGGVVWTDADSMEVTAAGTSGQLLQSNGAAAPSWATVGTVGSWVDYSATSTIVGWSALTTKLIYYVLIGKVCYVTFYLSGTSNATTATFTLPVTSAGSETLAGGIYIVNNGADSVNGGFADIAAATSTVSVYRNNQLLAFTNSGSKLVLGQLFFQTT